MDGYRLSSRLLRQHGLPALRRVRRTLWGALALGGAWSLGACGGSPPTAALSPVSAKNKEHVAAALTQVRFSPLHQAELAPTPAPVPVRQAARMVVLGDSISAGWGASDPTLSYANLLHRNANAVYPTDAQADLQHQFGAGLPIHHFAVHGETTTGVVQHQLPLLRTALFGSSTEAAGPVYGHTLVVLTAGGNNLRGELGPGGSPGRSPALAGALADLTTIFSFFDDPQRFPDGVSLYFATVYDMTDGADSANMCIRGLRFSGLSDALRKWRRGYMALAESYNEPPHPAHLSDRSFRHAPTLRVVPVDVHHSFLGHGFHYANESNHHFNPYDPTLWLNEQDCIHPNNRGHHELRRAFYQAITGRTAS
jgi:lysophospholipase L1-like esterase